MPDDTGAFRLPRVVKSLGWVSLFTDVATEMVYPLLPTFIRSIGGGAEALGLMEGVAESVNAVVKWLSGRSRAVARDRDSHSRPHRQGGPIRPAGFARRWCGSQGAARSRLRVPQHDGQHR